MIIIFDSSGFLSLCTDICIFCLALKIAELLGTSVSSSVKWGC